MDKNKDIPKLFLLRLLRTPNSVFLPYLGTHQVLEPALGLNSELQQGNDLAWRCIKDRVTSSE